MKRSIISTIIVLFLLLFTFCTGNQPKDAMLVKDVIGKMPASIKTIGYVNFGNIAKIDEFRNVLKETNMGYATELMEPFEYLVFGVGEVDPMNLSQTNEIVIFMSGKYNKSTLNKIVKDKMGLNEVSKIEKVEIIKNKDTALIYLSANLVAFTKLGFAETVVNSAKLGKNTIDTNSDLYKVSVNTNSELVWTVSDFNYLGKQVLSYISEGTGGGTHFNITTVNISKENKNLSFNISVVLDNSNVTKPTITILRTILPITYLLIKDRVASFINNSDAIKEIDGIISNLDFENSDKTISTTIKLTIPTIALLWKNISSIIGIFSN